MSPRFVLLLLWTALSFCLPPAFRVELCLCDGVAGLFDGLPCGATQATPAAGTCCGVTGPDAELGVDGNESSGCHCLSLELGRGTSSQHVGAKWTPPYASQRTTATSFAVRLSGTIQRWPGERDLAAAGRPVATPLRI